MSEGKSDTTVERCSQCGRPIIGDPTYVFKGKVYHDRCKDALRSQTTEFTRKEVNVAAKRLAENIRRFMEEGDQFLSLVRRYDLTHAALTLEDLADGR